MTDPAKAVPRLLKGYPGMALAAAILVLLVYFPAREFAFLTWDDHIYVTMNPLLKPDAKNWLTTALTSVYEGYYAPVLWSALRICHSLWGDDASAFHLLNVVLHCANAALVVLICREISLGKGVGFVAAVLWALHPLRVESVAWISELKDVLSGFFALLAVLCFFRWVRRRSKWDYVSSVALLGLALGTKPTTTWVVAPILAIALFFLRFAGRKVVSRQNTWSGVVRPLVPHLAISVAFAVLGALAQMKAKIIIGEIPESVFQRVLIASYSLCFHVWKSVLPVRLSALYDLPGPISITSLPYAASCLGALALVAVVLIFWRRQPWLSFCPLSFAVGMLPVLQIVRSPIRLADRYTYLPSLPATIVLAVLLWAGVSRSGARRTSRDVRGVLLVLLIVILSAATRYRLPIWRNTVTLWRSVIAHNPEKGHAHNSLGLALAEVYGQTGLTPQLLAEMEKEFRLAVKYLPNDVTAYINLARVLIDQGKTAEAEAYLVRAEQIAPTESMIPYTRISKLLAEGRPAQAAELLPDALRYPNPFPGMLRDIGQAFFNHGYAAEAEMCFRALTPGAPATAPAASTPREN